MLPHNSFHLVLVKLPRIIFFFACHYCSLCLKKYSYFTSIFKFSLNKPFYLFPLSLIWPPHRTVYFEILNIFLFHRFRLAYLTSTYLFTILFISPRPRCSNSYLNSTHSVPLVTLYKYMCLLLFTPEYMYCYFWTYMYKTFKQVPCKDQVETF